MKGLMTLSLIIIFSSFDLPAGWFKAGSKPKSYKMGIDKGAGKDGRNAATIKSKSGKIDGFGTLMQFSLPDKYRGKRVRMTGFLKTDKVSDWAGLWFRVDKKGFGSIAFDNMKNGTTDRSVKGTTEWTKYEIVLDVSQEATGLAYGALLSGTGQIWFDDINFEMVSDSIPVTGIEKQNLKKSNDPVNLDFEK